MGYTFINKNKTELWKKDTLESVDFYNKWFLKFAPKAFFNARNGLIEKVRQVMRETDNLSCITVEAIKSHPEMLSVLRMATAPPLALDRLAGLSHTSRNLIKRLEENKLPVRITDEDFANQLNSIIGIIRRTLDVEMMAWLPDGIVPDENEVLRSASIIADRLCGTLADPVIRNEQEARQLRSISVYLESRGYTFIEPERIDDFRLMPEYTFSYHLNIPVNLPTGSNVNIPVDVAIMRGGEEKDYPLLIECKSAGDFANTNKRRKEEAVKISQLKYTYGENIYFILFLCGYFDTTYLGYEASEGIDWIWEHRMSDFDKLNL